jgi:Cu+-exporting ATPase
MTQLSLQEITIPVDGMTCGGCAASVERALRKLPGVARVMVDLPKKQANIVYDPNQADLVEFQNAVQTAGYSIPTSEITLDVEGMTCVSCATHVGGALEGLDGVLSAEVNLKKNTAQVAYLPALVDVVKMKAAIEHVGYRVSGHNGTELGVEGVTAASPAKGEPRFTTERFSRFKKLITRS